VTTFYEIVKFIVLSNTPLLVGLVRRKCGGDPVHRGGGELHFAHRKNREKILSFYLKNTGFTPFTIVADFSNGTLRRVRHYFIVIVRKTFQLLEPRKPTLTLCNKILPPHRRGRVGVGVTKEEGKSAVGSLFEHFQTEHTFDNYSS